MKLQQLQRFVMVAQEKSLRDGPVDVVDVLASHVLPNRRQA
ncbi:hypothetical protein [Burkholderia sp. L27(2015)]|nr:hypothetical protein [Burkholderia sp. L27(2015)]